MTFRPSTPATMLLYNFALSIDKFARENPDLHEGHEHDAGAAYMTGFSMAMRLLREDEGAAKRLAAVMLSEEQGVVDKEEDRMLNALRTLLRSQA